MRAFLLGLALLLAPPAALAEDVAPMTDRPGWSVIATEHSYDALLERLRSAVKAQKFGLVTEAGPTGVAKSRGVEIPGNRVVGVFRNDYAVRILRLSTAAMIEAPIRFYVTENADGTATLAYKTPSVVFDPYFADAEADLRVAAEELDAAFAAIAAAATAAE
ncbi:MAG: DUF302 domain-containing protein [Pseudomonadota bacterium]